LFRSAGLAACDTSRIAISDLGGLVALARRSAIGACGFAELGRRTVIDAGGFDAGGIAALAGRADPGAAGIVALVECAVVDAAARFDIGAGGVESADVAGAGADAAPRAGPDAADPARDARAAGCVAARSVCRRGRARDRA